MTLFIRYMFKLKIKSSIFNRFDHNVFITGTSNILTTVLFDIVIAALLCSCMIWCVEFYEESPIGAYAAFTLFVQVLFLALLLGRVIIYKLMHFNCFHLAKHIRSSSNRKKIYIYDLNNLSESNRVNVLIKC